MNESNSGGGSAVAVAVVMAIIGLAVGFGGAKLIDKNNDDSGSSTTTSSNSTPDSTTKAADLRANLVTLGVAHQHLTEMAIDSALDGNADAEAVKADLIDNGAQISAAVGSVYGTEAQTQFQKLWNIHLTEFINYAVAGKKNDAAGKKMALDNIDTQYTTPIAALLSGANPNLPNDTVKTAFADHVSMTAVIIDDHNAANYAKEAKDRAEADKHIAGLMSTLAGAIVKQYPDKF